MRDLGFFFIRYLYIYILENHRTINNTSSESSRFEFHGQKRLHVGILYFVHNHSRHTFAVAVRQCAFHTFRVLDPHTIGAARHTTRRRLFRQLGRTFRTHSTHTSRCTTANRYCASTYTVHFFAVRFCKIEKQRTNCFK